MTEIDFYMDIPVKFHNSEKNHRLSLRKNLTTEKYELIKVIQKQIIGYAPFFGCTMIMNHPTGQIEVIFSHKDLEPVLVEANGIYNYYNSTEDYIEAPHIVCEHYPPNLTSLCQIRIKRPLKVMEVK
ncbi:MAG: hypothetical protein ACFFDN_00125 [Candidatus Hodarchaeota archaeon]